MVCIYCGHPTSVLNSRLQKRQNHTWRRRSCEGCGATFTTQERPVLSQGVLVRAADGHARPAPLSRDTLFLSIYECCKHRTNPVADAAALTETVLAKSLKTVANGAIDHDTLVAVSYEALSLFDSVAAALYAAYHM